MRKDDLIRFRITKIERKRADKKRKRGGFATLSAMFRNFINS